MTNTTQSECGRHEIEKRHMSRKRGVEQERQTEGHPVTYFIWIKKHSVFQISPDEIKLRISNLIDRLPDSGDGRRIREELSLLLKRFESEILLLNQTGLTKKNYKTFHGFLKNLNIVEEKVQQSFGFSLDQ